jgi:hypothetical protein
MNNPIDRPFICNSNLLIDSSQNLAPASATRRRILNWGLLGFGSTQAESGEVIANRRLA